MLQIKLCKSHTKSKRIQSEIKKIEIFNIMKKTPRAPKMNLSAFFGFINKCVLFAFL